MTDGLPAEAPSADDAALAVASESLGPERSLARVEGTAKFVFANVTVITAVLTGFGLLTGVGAAWDQGPHIFSVPLAIALAAAALLLATFALLPSLSRVDIADLEAVRSFYSRGIWRRGLSAAFAMVALAAAVASAVVTAAAQGEASHHLALSAVVHGGPGDPQFEASALVGGLTQGDVLVMSVDATLRTGEVFRVCDATSTPAQGGNATASCPKTSVRGVLQVTVNASVERTGKSIQQRTLVLPWQG